MAFARLGSISFDCDDPQPLARFWAELIGGEIAFSSDDFVAVKTDLGWISTVRVPDYRPTTWPNGAVPKQLHLDLAVDNLEAAESEAIRLGAVRPDYQPDPDRWRVMIDPSGHPFCLSTLIPD